jgi:hypothetical protein
MVGKDANFETQKKNAYEMGEYNKLQIAKTGSGLYGHPGNSIFKKDVSQVSGDLRSSKTTINHTVINHNGDKQKRAGNQAHQIDIDFGF